MKGLRRWGVLVVLIGVCGLLACAQNRQAGEPCFGTYECQPGLFCASGTCIVPSGQQGCQSNSQCPEAYRCRFNTCVDINTLRACTVSEAVQQCLKGQVCFEGFCSVAGEGDPCQNQQCPLGLVCDENSNPPVCRRGKTCKENADCDEDFVCERFLCVRERTIGECTTTDDCPEGLFCGDEGRCEVP